MNYQEYYKTYYNFKKAKNKLHKIQNDLADVINTLLSVSSQMKNDVAHNNSYNDKILELTVKKVDLEAREELTKELLAVREKQKNEAENELRKSANNKDMIYVRYFIEHLKPKEISIELSYAREYTYDLLKVIREDISKIDKELKEEDKKD